MRFFLVFSIMSLSVFWTASSRANEANTFAFEVSSDQNSPFLQKIWLVTHTEKLPAGEVYTIPKGTKLYNWGPRRMKRWAAQGFPNNAEMKRETAVLGFSVSANITATAAFGPVLVVHETKRDLQISNFDGKLLYQYKNELFSKLREVLDPSDPRVSYTELRTRLEDFLGLDGHADGYPIGRKWLTLNHFHEVLNSRLAQREDLYESDEFLSGQMGIKDFLMIEKEYPIPLSPILESRYPIIYKLLANAELTEPERNYLFCINFFLKKITWLQEQGRLGDLGKALLELANSQARL